MNRNKGRPSAYREPPRPLPPQVYRLRKARYERGICAYELAEQIGYSLTALQEWECGVKTPRKKSLIDWAQGLGLTLDEIR